MIETRNKKNIWIAFVSVLAFLALVFGLDQWIKPTDKLGMLLIVLQKGSVYALAAVSMNLLNGYTGLFSLTNPVTQCISISMRRSASLFRRSFPTAWAALVRRWVS